jgi:hypothetical protein
MHYGDLQFVFKPEVRMRTTVMPGDSLGPMGNGEQPTPINLPLGRMSAYTDMGMRRLVEKTLQNVPADQFYPYYTEVQIQGDLTLNDVQMLIDWDGSLSPDEISVLESYGIKIVYPTYGDDSTIPRGVKNMSVKALGLKDPYVVAQFGNWRLLMAGEDVKPEIKLRADAVAWHPGGGYSSPENLQVWLKWLVDLAEVEPYPWTDEARALAEEAAAERRRRIKEKWNNNAR